MSTFVRAAALAVVAGVLVVGPPAFADRDETGFPPPNPHGTQTTTNPGDDGDGTAYGQVKNCSVVSSPNYLGMTCAGGGDGWTVKSIKDTLDGDKLPHCWHEAMTPGEVEAFGFDTRDETTWYWFNCLEGINPHTLTVGPDGVSFTFGWVGLHPGDPVIELTENQQTLIDRYRPSTQIPVPVAAVSPMAHPRVGAWVSFFDAMEPPVVQVTAGSVILRASIENLTVHPLGDGITGPSQVPLPLTCSGTGYRAQRGDTPESAHSEACWFRYQRSSASQPDNHYPVTMTAHWVVQVSDDGGASWRPFNEFDKSQVTRLEVTEIEALVVR